jgi:hypothetical protein
MHNHATRSSARDYQEGIPMSGSCPGVHCPGCGKGGGALAILAAVVIAGIFIWRELIKLGHAVEHGTDVLRHTTYEVMLWSLAILGIAAGAAAAILLLLGLAVMVRRARERHAVARVPQTIVTSCTILPRSTPVPAGISDVNVDIPNTVPAVSDVNDDIPDHQPLAIERGPGLLTALLSALSYEGSPTGNADDQTLGPERSQALARGRLRNPELLMNGNDARDHRTGR